MQDLQLYVMLLVISARSATICDALVIRARSATICDAISYQCKICNLKEMETLRRTPQVSILIMACTMSSYEAYN